MSEMPSSLELARRWAERVRSGQFSSAILGLGTIRVMGRSGDTPVQFPRIASLDALGALEPDEQYAVRAAEAMLAQARAQSRAVFAVTVPPGGRAPAPVPVTTFDPAAESLVIVSRIAGG
jgi:hypothetical protein